MASVRALFSKIKHPLGRGLLLLGVLLASTALRAEGEQGMLDAVSTIQGVVKYDVYGFVGTMVGPILMISAGWRIGTRIADQQDWKKDLFEGIIGFALFSILTTGFGNTGDTGSPVGREVYTFFGEVINGLRYFGGSIGALLTMYYGGIISYKVVKGQDDWGLAMGAAIVGIFIVSASAMI